jgi:predicted ATPase
MFVLEKFKNFDQAEVDLDQQVTLLVGPNGAGKSNLIEAIELLAFLMEGHPLHEITDLGREGGLEIRGGLSSCTKQGEESFTIGYSGYPVRRNPTLKVDYRLTIQTSPQPRILDESLKRSDRPYPVFSVVSADPTGPSADNLVEYDNHRRGTNPQESVAADRTALSQYSRFARKDAELPDTLALIDSVVAASAAPSVFDPYPRLMRNHERITETALARNGYNLSPVIYSLSKPQRVVVRSPDGKHSVKIIDRSDVAKRILARIKQLPDEPFLEFDFFRTRTAEVQLGFKIDGAESLPAKLLSDGTLRALAILTALETSPAGTRIILEELDNGVHPSRVHILMEALFECANRNKLRVLASTHNPAALDSLSRKQLDSVLLVIGQTKQSGARLIPLPQLPGWPEFVDSGRLGDLVTRRVYEQHLRPDFQESQKKAFDDWFATLP